MARKRDDAGIGHNGGPPMDASALDAATKRLVDRIRLLEEEKKGIADDIKDCYDEAKGHGINVKAMRLAIRTLKQPKDEYETLMAELDRMLGILT